MTKKGNWQSQWKYFSPQKPPRLLDTALCYSTFFSLGDSPRLIVERKKRQNLSRIPARGAAISMPTYDHQKGGRDNNVIIPPPSHPAWPLAGWLRSLNLFSSFIEAVVARYHG